MSKNTVLMSLAYGINQLTNLDLSKNTALTALGCRNNQLTSLDVRKNIALTDLSCENQLTVEGLNALFGTLHENAGRKTINVVGTGYYDCDQSIAEAKGRAVK